MERWRRLDLGQVGHSGQKFSIFLLQLDEKKLQERLNKRRLIFRKDEEEEEKFWKAKNLVDVNFFRGSGFEPLVPGNARHSNLRPYSSLPVLTVRYLDEIQHGEGFPGGISQARILINPLLGFGTDASRRETDQGKPSSRVLIPFTTSVVHPKQKQTILLFTVSSSGRVCFDAKKRCYLICCPMLPNMIAVTNCWASATCLLWCRLNVRPSNRRREAKDEESNVSFLFSILWCQPKERITKEEHSCFYFIVIDFIVCDTACMQPPTLSL